MHQCFFVIFIIYNSILYGELLVLGDVVGRDDLRYLIAQIPLRGLVYRLELHEVFLELGLVKINLAAYVNEVVLRLLKPLA